MLVDGINSAESETEQRIWRELWGDWEGGAEHSGFRRRWDGLYARHDMAGINPAPQRPEAPWR
jgi:hypothetical protein